MGYPKFTSYVAVGGDLFVCDNFINPEYVENFWANEAEYGGSTIYLRGGYHIHVLQSVTEVRKRLQIQNARRAA